MSQPQRLFAVGRRPHLETVPGEPTAKRVPELQVVVHDEQINGYGRVMVSIQDETQVIENRACG